ncbi:hypothetical protein K0M31_015924 [Melipona bicolor]|uniref:Uncharacterized protein n=1 Tax=Melipona bicolor TaxID=60889 RepID=A0AA40G7C5_9HYME|nr:hypothetical protein K0M31_015924 [Melipona bicolor]
MERFDVLADGIYALPATDGVALLSSRGFVGSKPPADALAEGAQVRAASRNSRKQDESERAGSCLSGRTLDAAPAASVKPATPALHPLLPRSRRGQAANAQENTAAAAAAAAAAVAAAAATTAAAAAIRYVLSRERARKQPGAAKFLPPLGASRL